MAAGMTTGDEESGTMIGSLAALAGEVSKTLFSDLTGVTGAGAVASTLRDAVADDMTSVLPRDAQSSSK